MVIIICYNYIGDSMILIERARHLIENKKRDRNGNSKSCHFVNLDGIDYALLTYGCNEENQKKVLFRINETMKLIREGFHTPDTYDIYFDENTAYELQGMAKGKTFAYRRISDAGDIESYMKDILLSLKSVENSEKESLLNLLNDSKIFWENGHSLDCHPDNFYIDENGNFTVIDLDIIEEKEKRLPYYDGIANTLPYILSFLKIEPNSPFYEECIESLHSIAIIWIDACVIFLKNNGLENEEIKKIIGSINFNYFKIGNDEKTGMLKTYFDEREKH